MSAVARKQQFVTSFFLSTVGVLRCHNWGDIFYNSADIFRVHSWVLCEWMAQVACNCIYFFWDRFYCPSLTTRYLLCRYFSIVAVAVGAILFVLTSFSDPGTVTAENVSQYVSAYPYDNIIFVEKECSTCKITRYIFTNLSASYFMLKIVE